MGITEVNEVKKLADSSPTAKIITKYLAGRERMRHFTDTNRLRVLLKTEGEKVDDNEFDGFWKEASKRELGSLDKKGRFRWHYNLKTVGQIGIGRQPEDALEKLEVKSSVAVKRPRGRPAGINTKKVETVNQVAYYFRNKLLFLPLDISNTEADKLAQFIKNIPQFQKGV